MQEKTLIFLWCNSRYHA